MLRLIAVTALLCLFSSATDARPRQARPDSAAFTYCASDQTYRQTCWQVEKRIQSRRTGRAGYSEDAQIVAHPEGCPRRLFCGCGVSVKAFGKPIRELFLASNYGYYFNVGTFAAGNAAWTSGHVVYILGGTESNALVYDPNSGQRLTRIHHRDLSRYRIADLSSPKRRLASR